MNRPDRLQVLYSSKIILSVFLIAAVLVVGCSGKYGLVVYNYDVKKMFETYQLPLDHTYYYSGTEVFPKAMIGIQNEFRLESKYWKQVEPNQDLLKKWFDRQRLEQGYVWKKNGSQIISPDGNPIGIWYSLGKWKNSAMVKMIDDNTVFIGHPVEGRKGGGGSR